MTTVEQTLVDGERRCLDCGRTLSRFRVALCGDCVLKRQRIYAESQHHDDLKVKGK